MVSTLKRKQSNRRLLSQLNDFDPDASIGNTVSVRQENYAVNEGTSDQELTVDYLGSNLALNEMKTW